jgi:hypothetical protein
MCLAGGSTLSLRCLAGPSGLRPTAARLPGGGLPSACGGLPSGRRLAFARWFLCLLCRGRRTLRLSGNNPAPGTRRHRPGQRDNRHRTSKLAPDARHGLIVFPAHTSTLIAFPNLNTSNPPRTTREPPQIRSRYAQDNQQLGHFWISSPSILICLKLHHPPHPHLLIFALNPSGIYTERDADSPCL